MKIHVEEQLYYEKEDILGFFFTPSYNTVTGQSLLNIKYGTTCFGIHYRRLYNAHENDFSNNFYGGESKDYLNIKNYLNAD